MAYTASTPSTVTRESVGSMTMHIATFAAFSSASWASGLPNTIGYWANTDSGSGCGVSAVAPSAGTSGYTFIMTVGDLGASNTVNLYVLSKT